MKRSDPEDLDSLAGKCLAAFISAGSLDLSLDRLTAAVGTSKRMLIHYFGSRDNLEMRAIALLEHRLRAQFKPERFPAGAPLRAVVEALWTQSTDPSSRGVLLVIMDTARRAWSGSDRGRAFYAEQQRLWFDLLQIYLPDPAAVEELLQLFQGAILAYLVTGDPEPGRRSLARCTAGFEP